MAVSVGVFAVAIVVLSSSSALNTPTTSLSDFCSSLIGSVFWLPHSGTCVQRIRSTNKPCSDWFESVPNDVYANLTGVISSRLTIVYDERDFDQIGYASGVFSIKTLGDATDANNWYWCDSKDCLNPVEITNKALITPSTTSAVACGYYQASSGKLEAFSWQGGINIVYQQFLNAKRRPSTLLKLWKVGARISKPILRQYSVLALTDCSIHCLRLLDCQAFNYAAELKSCQLSIKIETYLTNDSNYNVYAIADAPY